MSLGDLPTELDVRIIEYLHRDELLQMVGVSKYYQKLSEPLLYQNVKIWSNQDRRLKRLLATLLSRKDLRNHVKAFELCHMRDAIHTTVPLPQLVSSFPDQQNLQVHSLCDLLWSQVEEIRSALDSITAQYRIGSETRNVWFSKMFERPPLYDGVLILVFCLITEVHRISLMFSSNHPVPLTRKLFFHEFRGRSNNKGSERLFSKLKCLRIEENKDFQGAYQIHVPPDLEELSILGYCGRYPLLHPLSQSANAHALQSLVFRETSMDPRLLVHNLASMRSLRRLAVYGLGLRDTPQQHHPPWINYDYTNLKNALLEHAPSLEYLMWTDMQYTGAIAPGFRAFGSCERFLHLKDLRLDYDLLVDPAPNYAQHRLGDPMEILTSLPPRLERFEVTQFFWPLIERAHVRFLRTRVSQPTVLNNFEQLLSTLSIKNILIVINMDAWESRYREEEDVRSFPIDEPEIHDLRAFSESLHSHDINLEIDYHFDCDSTATNALVRHNMTATEVSYDA